MHPKIHSLDLRYWVCLFKRHLPPSPLICEAFVKSLFMRKTEWQREREQESDLSSASSLSNCPQQPATPDESPTGPKYLGILHCRKLCEKQHSSTGRDLSIWLFNLLRHNHDSQTHISYSSRSSTFTFSRKIVMVPKSSFHSKTGLVSRAPVRARVQLYTNDLTHHFIISNLFAHLTH